MVTVMAVGAGSATVTVTATDTGGLEAEAGFTVTVEQPNRAPEVAEAIPAQTMNVAIRSGWPCPATSRTPTATR